MSRVVACGLASHDARDKAADVRDGKTDPLQIGRDGDAGDGPGISGGEESRSVGTVSDSHAFARARPIELHRDDAGEAAWEPADAVALFRGDDHRTTIHRKRDCVRQTCGVLRACGAEAEVDDAHARVGRPVNRADQPVGRRRERAVEHFHGVQLSVRRLLTDGRGDGGAMSDPIADVVVLLVVAHRCAAGDPADVRMVCVNAAVDHRDAHAAAGAVMPAHERPARPRARRTGSRTRLCSGADASSSTSTRSARRATSSR